MTTWLVTGGAGYVGSHVVRALLASGRQVVVLDDLSSGLRRRVPEDAPLIEADVHDATALAHTFRSRPIDGVVHCAARKAAGESVEVPLYYYRENVDGLLSLLEAMEGTGVQRMVFSSSAAVYGSPDGNPVPEDAALRPESPYGETKAIGEWLVRDSGVAWGLSWSTLRYFNVAGAASDDLGDSSVNNLIPMVFRALEQGQRPQIFGDDYPTPDGTCIRDYIDVQDLAQAHVLAAQRCETGMRRDVFNVGRGRGASVREVMDAIASVLGRELDPQVVARRAGDPPATWAATGWIEKELGWQATRDLGQMVSSAWSAWQAHPPR